MFELTKDEYDSLRCIFFTFKGNGRGQHSKYLPYVFTQEGIAIGKSVCENHRPGWYDTKKLRPIGAKAFALTARNRLLLHYTQGDALSYMLTALSGHHLPHIYSLLLTPLGVSKWLL